MKKYEVTIDNDDEGAPGGDWTAALTYFNDDGTRDPYPITVGIGATISEAIKDMGVEHYEATGEILTTTTDDQER